MSDDALAIVGDLLRSMAYGHRTEGRLLAIASLFIGGPETCVASAQIETTGILGEEAS